MKKTFNQLAKLVCIVVMVYCMVIPLSAQTKKIHPHHFTYQVTFPNTQLWDDIKVNCKAYYDEEDNDIYHGPFSANHVRELNAQGVVGKLEYTASGNYVDGELDGALNITVKESGSRPKKFTYTRTLSASYKNGVPTGKWTVKEAGTTGSESFSYSMTAIYKDGDIESISTSNGSKLTFDFIEEGWEGKIYSVSGVWGKESFFKGIDESRFEKKNGDHSEVDEETKSILKDLKTGKIPENDLIDKGYTTIVYGSITNKIFENWDILMGINGGFNIYALEDNTYLKKKARMDGKAKGFDYRTASRKYIYMTYILKRVNLIDADKIIASLESEPTLKREHIQHIEKNMLYFRNEYGIDKPCYFNNDSKAKIIAYLNKRISEEKNVIAMRDSLTTFINKYKSVSYLSSEVASFKAINFKSDVNRGDSTLLKNYVSQMSVYDEICQNKIKVYEEGDKILSETKSSYPDIYKSYNIIFNRYYAKGCPRDANQLGSYLQDIKDLKEEQELVKRYIATYQETVSNSAKINSNARKEVLNAYKKASNANDFKLSENVKQSLNQIEAWSEKQEQYIAIDSLWGVALINDALVSEKLGTNFADVNKNYSSYRKKNSISIKEDLNATLENINKIIAVQDGCIKFIDERAKIAETDAKILENGKVYKEYIKGYTQYMKGMDLTWTEANDIQKLLDVQNVQSKFDVVCGLWGEVLKNDALVLEKLGKNFSDVNKNYSKYRKDNPLVIQENIDATIESINKIIKVQEGCFNFINERAKIAEADARILTNGKAYKNIIKTYKDYMKGTDIAWTESYDIQKLQEVQGVQAKFEAAFTKPNVSEMDGFIKKSKDKSLNIVLDIISK